MIRLIYQRKLNLPELQFSKFLFLSF